MLEGPASDRLVGLLQVYAGEAVDTAASLAKPVVTLALGSRGVTFKLDFSSPCSGRSPGGPCDYAGEALDVQGELERNLKICLIRTSSRS